MFAFVCYRRERDYRFLRSSSLSSPSLWSPLNQLLKTFTRLFWLSSIPLCRMFSLVALTGHLQAEFLLLLPPNKTRVLPAKLSSPLRLEWLKEAQDHK
ncbi:uncharacterized protein LOC124194596 isoform X2 [Daphnia pulex]|uniref:uncharacterized protein LOC124194596 isoform X2 n=1 Tax=Daphnia pulex TaxID=6669 RepID=UPI001EDE3C08|nr:uncharacterized protein LOC124194596 isoform X2 [Daphnia pulex]